MKKVFAAILSLSLALSVFAMPAFAAGYGDTDEHWAKNHIARWTGYDVVQGYPDGNFYPEEGMTRAEAATVFTNLLELSDTADISKFADVPANEWYADAIAKCYAAGIMKGVSDNAMDPNGTLTREQMMVMVGRALHIEEDTNLNDGKGFPDYDKTSDWAKGYINALVNAGIVDGTGNGLEPTIDIDRASMMALLDKSITVYANVDGAEVPANGGGVVLIVADDVTIKNAPEGTIVVTAPEATGAKVNGEAVNEDTVIVVPPAGTEETTPGTGNTGTEETTPGTGNTGTEETTPGTGNTGTEETTPGEVPTDNIEG